MFTELLHSAISLDFWAEKLGAVADDIEAQAAALEAFAQTEDDNLRTLSERLQAHQDAVDNTWLQRLHENIGNACHYLKKLRSLKDPGSQKAIFEQLLEKLVAVSNLLKLKDLSDIVSGLRDVCVLTVDATSIVTVPDLSLLTLFTSIKSIVKSSQSLGKKVEGFKNRLRTLFSAGNTGEAPEHRGGISEEERATTEDTIRKVKELPIPRMSQGVARQE